MPSPGFNDSFVSGGVIQALKGAYNSVGAFLGLVDPRSGNTAPIPYFITQTGVPAIIPSNGTIDGAGLVTLVTALDFTYANAWCYFPAGAVTGGQAGFYFVRFSSTTVGQVFTNFIDAQVSSFIASIPTTTLVNAVGSAVAYTQTINQNINLINVTVPGNSFGLNGGIKFDAWCSYPNTAGAKITNVLYGAQQFRGASRTTFTGQSFYALLRNRGVTNSQYGMLMVDGGSPAISIGTVDTTVNQQLVLFGNMNTATDYIVLGGISLEIQKV